MKKAYLFLATGFEEVEALTVCDVLRRGNVDCKLVSVTGDYEVKSSHNVAVRADLLFDKQSFSDADLLILPGGIPGTPNLKAHKGLAELLTEHKEAGKYLAAICAAPTVFGEMGFLEGKKATCYPGMEDGLLGAVPCTDEVVVDGQFITSRGMGTSIAFGLMLLSLLVDKKTAESMAEKIVYHG